MVKISLNLGDSANGGQEEESDEEDDEVQYFKGENYVEKCLYQVLSKLIYVQKLELIFKK